MFRIWENPHPNLVFLDVQWNARTFMQVGTWNLSNIQVSGDYNYSPEACSSKFKSPGRSELFLNHFIVKNNLHTWYEAFLGNLLALPQELLIFGKSRFLESRISGDPDFWHSGNPEGPDVRISGILEIRSFGNPDFRNSGDSKLRISWIPYFQISGYRNSRYPEFWKSWLWYCLSALMPSLLKS